MCSDDVGGHGILCRTSRASRRYLDIISLIRDHGFNVKELIIGCLPKELEHTLKLVRESFTTYVVKKTSTFNDVLTRYQSIPNVETLVRYVMLYSCLMAGIRVLKVDRLCELLRREYNNVREFIESPRYDDVSSVVKRICDEYGIVSDADRNLLADELRRFVRYVRRTTLAQKMRIFEKIMRYRDLRELESDLRDLFASSFSERKRVALKLLARVFAHETNIPIAVLVIRSGKFREYTPAADMYSVITTIRSGVFLALGPESNKVRDLERKLLMSQGVVKLRRKSFRSILAGVARLSGDPILYERGAFDIGYKYCSKNRCSECPLHEKCVKLNVMVSIK